MSTELSLVVEILQAQGYDVGEAVEVVAPARPDGVWLIGFRATGGPDY